MIGIVAKGTSPQLVLLRVATGLCLLLSGLVVCRMWADGSHFAGVLRDLARPHPWAPVRTLLLGKAQIYSGLLAVLAVSGQVVLGALLVAGLLTRLAGGIGALGCAVALLLQPTWRTQSAELLFILLAVLTTLGSARAGRTCGLDARLARRADVLPFNLFY